MPRDTEDLQQRGDRCVGRAQPRRVRALTAACARAVSPARARPLAPPKTDIHTLRRTTQSQSPKRSINVLNYFVTITFIVFILYYQQLLFQS